jgi:hypothetical protein
MLRYVLTAGQRSPWIELRGVSAFEMQGKNASSSVCGLYGANVDPTSKSATVDDEVLVESFGGTSFARSLYSPMPRFVYVKNTAGTGTVTITFGQAVNDLGRISQLNELGFPAGTSGRSNEMPS